jgi:hypothetical protein
MKAWQIIKLEPDLPKVIDKKVLICVLKLLEYGQEQIKEVHLSEKNIINRTLNNFSTPELKR